MADNEKFEIKPANRTGVKPLVGFYGKSGSGKTMSALLFARGLAGQSGRVTLIDSESGRGSIFADVIPGGYSVIDLDAPFTPARYQQAIVTAEQASDVVVVDSMSHEWSGEGGILEMQDAELDRMAGDDMRRRESCKMAAWIKPKMAHKLMVSRLLRCKVPLICCLRADEKTHTAPDEKRPGKMTVITDQFSSPQFDPRFIYEMLLNFETLAKAGVGGYVIARKVTHPDIGRLLPGADEQIGVKHGEALRAWCGGKPAAASAAQSASTTAPSSVRQLKGALWKLMEHIHQCQPGDSADLVELGRNRVQQHLWDDGILSDTETLAELAENRLREIVNTIRKKGTK